MTVSLSFAIHTKVLCRPSEVFLVQALVCYTTKNVLNEIT
jgi:hypothetical protein